MDRATIRLLSALLLLAAAPTPRGVPALHDPARLVEAGREMEARGQAAQAMGFYDQALAIDPANVVALTAAARNAIARGDGDDALTYYAQLSKVAPSSADAWLGLAMAQVLRMQPAEALPALARAEDLGAGRAPVGSQRGLAYDLLGDFRSAQVAYAGALAAAPGSIEIGRRLALSLAVSGGRPAALQVLRRFEGDPTLSVPLRQTMAMVYALTGDPDTADEIARSVLPADQAKQMSGFFAALPTLAPHDKTIAALFGRLPGGAAPETSARSIAEVAPAPALAPVPKHVTVATSVAAPERLWLQVANVPDASKLGETWADLAKAGGPDLRAPKTSASLRGSRLLIGPYASRAEMNAAVGRLRARGVPSFPVTTPAGTDVTDVAEGQPR